MDDLMMDLMAGNDLLRRRLEAYADLRLSPDLATSSRLRARVLAVAHRHASLARADAALTVLSPGDGVTFVRPSGNLSLEARRPLAQAPGGRRRGAAGVALAASLAAVMIVGGVSAARPGAPLYEARLWTETLALPTDPSAHAVAELGRLRDRLREIGEASRAGDTAAVMAALAAYESIVEEASAVAILAGDDVAAAALETGVGQNVDVLRALAARLPANASAAIARAVDAAISRSNEAVDRIGASRPGGGRGDGAGSGPVNPPRATKAPTAEPTPRATPKPKATRKSTPAPTATPEPRATPDRTPRPRSNQGEAGPPVTMDPASGADSQDEDD
jgi:hypothetical protein